MKSRTRVVRRTRVTRHQHSRGGKERHNPRAGRSQSADGRQEVQSWIGHEPAELFQIIRKTVQRKNPIIQRSESGDRADHDSPDSVCRETRSTRCVKSIPPNTEKWLRKRYDENYNNDMSNETKRETNYSMNNK